MTKKTDKAQPVRLYGLEIEKMVVTIIGKTPLIVHAFAAKSQRQMLEKQMGSGSRTSGRPKKNPHADYTGCFYLNDNGELVFPVACIKASMLNAIRLTQLKGTEFAAAVHAAGNWWMRVYGTPRPRSDIVRLASGVPDIRYRPEFPEWLMDIALEFHAATVSREQVVNVLEIAGWGIGIGDYRPFSKKNRTGSFGRFEILRDPEDPRAKAIRAMPQSTEAPADWDPVTELSEDEIVAAATEEET